MTINNLMRILSILSFDSNDEFYFLQIIKRKKENPELKNNAKVIKTYRIKSKDQLLEKFEEIKTLCKVFNARAYINLNRRSFKKLAFKTLEKITNQILNEDYENVKNAYDSVSGTYSNESLTKWIVDIDKKDIDFGVIFEQINKCAPKEVENKIISVIPTVNGYHIITRPFNLKEFNCDTIDVHKNNPTLLYYNNSK